MSLRPGQCKRCRKTKPHLSLQRLCKQCGLEKATIAAIQMKNKKGHYFNKYKSGLKRFLRRSD